MSTTTPVQPAPGAPQGAVPDDEASEPSAGGRVGAGSFSPRPLLAALPTAARKLDPRDQVRHPVMMVVWVGSVATTVLAVLDRSVFAVLVAAWLWATVLFAGLAEAVAEGRGRAQAESLRRARATTTTRRLRADGTEEELAAPELHVGDLVVVEAGDVVPGDGDVVEGVASVDESAVTGESAPVVRESGGDRSSATGGTTVLSDRIVVRITAEPGASFLDRMIALVEGSSRAETPNERALDLLLSSLTLVFLLAVVTLQPFSAYSGQVQPLVVLVALLVCLIPTTIGALLSAIGIAGMDRLVQRNVLAMSGRAVEAAGDVDVLLLDKTGTITYGARRATALLPAPGVGADELAAAARLASVADETPEGRSVVALVDAGDDDAPGARATTPEGDLVEVPFTAQTRMSGVDLGPGAPGGARSVRKGAAASVLAWVRAKGGGASPAVDAAVEDVARRGGTPLVVAERADGAPARVLGVVQLEDVVKEGMAARFAELRRMGIRTVMVTGDNPVTAAAIARQAGVDDVIAEATPEDKMARIRAEQAGGHLVAMTGDGTNDAPALAQADVGVAMGSGTSAAKEAGNMVDLDSDPTKLIEVVAIGKQLLITRGALTTFSLANDVAKYFAILPALFAGLFPGPEALDVMHLATPQSAVLSAVVFNALVIVALIPLALRGVRYRPADASSLLRRNLLVFGLGGVVAPFVGIKALDLLLSLLPGIG
nr:potassium-transporting ATPase subunit KdpB [uncultured Pseudokineococcus sp.]